MSLRRIVVEYTVIRDPLNEEVRVYLESPKRRRFMSRETGTRNFEAQSPRVSRDAFHRGSEESVAELD